MHREVSRRGIPMIRRMISIAAALLCLAGWQQAIAASAGDQLIQRNVNRGGGDYTHFEVSATNTIIGDVGACQTACSGDAKCKAWTLVRAGVQGPKPVCWL